MDILNHTGVPLKYSGDQLSHKDFNKINVSINSSIDNINSLLKSLFNVNLENNSPSKLYSLQEAISLVPLDRRNLSLRVVFLSSLNKIIEYSEYIYTGNLLDDENWNNVINWTPFNTIIDGGEWD